MITQKTISGPGNTVAHNYAYDSIDRLISEIVEQAFLPAQTDVYSRDRTGNVGYSTNEFYVFTSGGVPSSASYTE